MVTDNLQEKAKRKNKTNLLIDTFFNLTLRSQTLANIHEIFQNMSYRSTLHYILHLHFTHFTISFCTPYTCLVFQVAPIAEILWCISNFYMARDDLPSFGYFKKIALSNLFEKLGKVETKNFWITTNTIRENGDCHHFFIQIPILCLANFWSIMPAKPMFWVQQLNYFGYCF